MEQIIQRTSISQQVVDHLLDRIDRGELKPGERLPGERDLAASLGISRVPLREAISALCVIGVLEKRQGSGTFVSSFSPQTLGRILRTYTMLDGSLTGNLFEARMAVEGTAARLAAENASQEDIQNLSARIDEMEEAIPAYIRGEKTLTDMLALDALFHLQCAAASHNQFYLQFVSIVHTAGTDMGLYEAVYGQDREKYWESVEHHRRILAAIAAGDGRQAESAMSGHIQAIQTHTERGA
ncbi:MAG: FadR family transcriptional regulator [Oscillospiraceae bacterium]|nr:FadR family transcriptional regulator [Oscillospiraceae bacterium]